MTLAQTMNYCTLFMSRNVMHNSWPDEKTKHAKLKSRVNFTASVPVEAGYEAGLASFNSLGWETSRHLVARLVGVE